MLTIDAFVEALTLESIGDDRYRAGNVDAGHGVLYGGQLLAQSVIAGLMSEPDKAVKTVHTIFARSGSPDAPVEIVVDRMHSGRAMASCTVTISQGERLCARSQVLLSADEPNFIHHADAMPSAPRPEDSVATAEEVAAWQVRIAGDADIIDPDHTGPPDLDVWIRFAGAPRRRGTEPGAARVRHRRFSHRHRDAPARRCRTGPSPRHVVDGRAESHAHVPRTVVRG